MLKSLKMCFISKKLKLKAVGNIVIAKLRTTKAQLKSPFIKAQ